MKNRTHFLGTAYIIASLSLYSCGGGEGNTGNKITESRCASCRKCVDICPHKALTGLDWDINARRNDIIDYHLCNLKRSKYIEKHGRKSTCGLCMVVCPYGIEKG